MGVTHRKASEYVTPRALLRLVAEPLRSVPKLQHGISDTSEHKGCLKSGAPGNFIRIGVA